MSIIKYKYAILIVSVLLIACSLVLLPRFQTSYNFEHFLPTNDPYYAHTASFKENVGDDSKVLILAIECNRTIYDSGIVSSIDSVTRIVNKWAEVEQATSLTNLQERVKGPFGWFSFPVLRPGKSDYTQDSIRIANEPRYAGMFVSEEATAFSILIKAVDSINEQGKKSLIHRIETLPDFSHVVDFHVVGKINTEVLYIRILESENARLMPLFLLVALTVIFIIYRSWQSMIIILVSQIVALILMYGYAAGIGRTLNIGSLMYPTIIVVIGTSNMIHFYAEYLTLRRDHSRKEAILLSFSRMKYILFLTCLTTAIGFFSISRSSIQQVREFGLDGIVGVFIVLTITLFISSLLIYWLPDPRKTNHLERSWKWLISNVKLVAGFPPYYGIIASILLLALSLIGIQQLNRNNTLFGNLADDHKIVRDAKFFENQLIGSRTIYFLIKAPDNQLLKSIETVKELDRLEQMIMSFPESKHVFSTLTLYKSINKALNGGLQKQYTLPDSQQKMDQISDLSAKNFRQLYQNDSMAFMVLGMLDPGRIRVNQMLNEINDWVSKSNVLADVTLLPAGTDLLIDKNNEYLVSEMLNGFLLAFTIIAFLMIYLFRKIKVVLIAIWVNILPLLMTAGLMGFLGISLNGSTAFLFTIGFVIAVDDSLHFLSRLNQNRQLGVDPPIIKTLDSVTQPITITSIVLVCGYLVAVFSEVKEAHYHGILIGSTLVFALLADLFLLPVLLKYQWKN